MNVRLLAPLLVVCALLVASPAAARPAVPVRTGAVKQPAAAKPSCRRTKKHEHRPCRRPAKTHGTRTASAAASATAQTASTTTTAAAPESAGPTTTNAAPEEPPAPVPSGPPPSISTPNGPAARFSDQSGTLWMQGVHFGGSDLTGGVQLQEPGATVVMRDVLFDRVYGSQTTNHAELIQTWAGPARLLIDGLTGSSTYQGLFLEPNQCYNGPPPTVFDPRHIDIDDSQGAYALWLGDVTGSPSSDASGAILTWNVEDVYVVPNPARTWPGWWLWPQPETGDPTWANVISGAPPGGSYVQPTATGATGVDESTDPSTLVGEQS